MNEIQFMLNVKLIMIPVVIGATESISESSDSI
jgi:hypothetical protein